MPIGDFTEMPPEEEKRADARKQIPLRMDPALFERLEAEAKSQSKSVNALVCEAIEGRLSSEPNMLRKDEVRYAIRQAIETEARISGFNVDSAVIQRAIYRALKIDPNETLL